ncbi:serine hydrolase [Sphingosinicella rhizophila]|uniref:Serine hydrolase n=1 Tax=Sphingosinicella rhizophila TaxID=3050082 RepID=A0ABU3Q646_9SPHN|nr:serine hydrolase [Sphingosinicella sp. GR2756]MDT9598882.1 serine hydrolase [Sphingosinicella sp. GR2756]
MRYFAAWALASFLAAPALAAPPSGFDQRVEALRRSFGAPGVSIAIVEDGKPTLARGYGVRVHGKPEPVGPETIFATGSTGKAFTVAALAILVDQGTIGWDDPVIDHMPDFRMWDPWVTREMTIRDLLVHRSGLGLGAGDLLFVPRSDLSRKESVRRLRYIKPATSFRSAYAYDNVLYMAAGQLIEEVTGQTWEEFVKANIYRPAGMDVSTVDDAGRIATANRARPHARLNGPIRGLGDLEPLDETADQASNVAPAGGLAISADDMTRWLMIQLAHGKLPEGDGRLFSAEAAAEMWRPVTLQPVDPVPADLQPTQPMFSTYALGWDVQDYRGAKIVWHGGAVFGSLTAVVLIPDRNVGFSIATNSEEGQIVRGLMYELLDHYLGLPKAGWPEKLAAHKARRAAAAVKAVQAEGAARARVGPSLPLIRYAGDYADPWYGTISVRRVGDRLRVDFPHTPGLSATLEHWQYDTFRTAFNDRGMEPAFMTFSLDADGKVDRITMKPVSPLADFSFDYQDLLFTPVKASR